MRYRRDYTAGATYFFTVVVFRRKPLFADPVRVAQLRAAFQAEMARRPFYIDAMVVMPDHLHAIWTMPPGDSKYSIRWRNIKRSLTWAIEPENRPTASARRRHKGEQAIWQPRFWEHRLRDDTDDARHIDYIHYNPVKHGYVKRPVDWPHSSIHRYIRQGILSAQWGASIELPDGIGHE